MRYLRGSTEIGLSYGTTEKLEIFSDADYAGDTESRKSTSGLVSMYGGAAITWQTKEQPCVAQSTTEVEYISAASAAKETIWLKRLFSYVRVKCK